MSFPQDVKQEALLACGRCCSICHKFCGSKIEVHHIRKESEGGDNSIGNAIPLCLDCHADMRSYDHKHPIGNKYTESELHRHRHNWFERVKGNIGVTNRDTVVETDKQIYQLLVNILPWNGSIDFIRTYDLVGSFRMSHLDDLYKFEYQCNNPAFEFIDPDLEGLRANLLEHISSFTLTIAANTFPTDNIDIHELPKEWEIEHPERFQKVVSSLHDTAEKIVDTYSSLVKTATRKLGILALKVCSIPEDTGKMPISWIRYDGRKCE